MGLLDAIGRFLSPVAAVPQLATWPAVQATLPPGATYVSCGLVGLLADAEAFNGDPPGQGTYGRDLGMLPPECQQEVALLILTADELLTGSPDGIRWRCSISDLLALDAHRQSGFVVFTRSGAGLAVSGQTPVQLPPDAVVRTVPRVTNQFSGWDVELPVPHHW